MAPRRSDTPRKRKIIASICGEGGALVKGTLDPQIALKYAVEQIGDEWLGLYALRNEDNPQDDARVLGDRLHQWLADARPGLYRWVPAQPGDDYRCWLWPAERPGRGAFEAVAFEGW